MFHTLIAYTILFIIFLYVKKKASHSYNPTSAYFTKGYGGKKESIATLLTRTEWANNYKGRINIVWRHMAYAFLIVLILSLVLFSEVLSPQKYVQGVFTVFILLQAFHFFTQHHCEKFAHYAIDRNIKIIRKRLGLSKVSVDPQKCKFVGASSCWNYNYNQDF